MLAVVSVLLFLALLIEGTWFAIPLVLVVLLGMMIYFQSDFVLFFAFLGGLILDIMLLRTIGLTSLFFVIYLSIIALYDKKFEVNSINFVIFSTTIGVVFYQLIFGLSLVIWQVILSLALSVLLFSTMTRFRRQED